MLFQYSCKNFNTLLQSTLLSGNRSVIFVRGEEVDYVTGELKILFINAFSYTCMNYFFLTYSNNRMSSYSRPKKSVSCDQIHAILIQLITSIQPAPP